MQRRTSTATASTDILDENICIGPLYMRMRNKETQSGTGGDHEYNHAEFNTRYKNAKLFIMKSCNKEDVLNSIIHRVWAATTSMGNCKLNAAYHEASHARDQTQSNCPVFLLFSISFLILIRAFFTSSLFLSLSFS